MLENPKDLVGKWFSNFFGYPEEYTFFLYVEHEKDDLNFIRATSINIRQSSLRYYNLTPMSIGRFKATPLSYDRVPELQKVARKAIKYIFEKGI